MAITSKDEVINLLKENGRINDEALLEKVRSVFTEEECAQLEKAFMNMISEWY